MSEFVFDPTIIKLNWRRDNPDKRDVEFTVSMPVAVSRYVMDIPFRYNQLELGSCTAQTGRALFRFTAIEEQERYEDLSALFLYYQSRLDMGTVGEDSGATLRGMMRALAKYGIPLEKDWPYIIGNFKKKPTKAVYEKAAKRKLTSRMYGRVPHNLEALKATIAANNPIAFGFSVPESFMSNAMARSGVMKMPSLDERVVGGHAMLIIGFDDSEGCFYVLNSWGSKWGINGVCKMPYAFIADPDYCSDFWTLFTAPTVAIKVDALDSVA
jgi:C1A family cysteine protease